MEPSPLLKVMGWVFDGDDRLVGVVVATGHHWIYRPFRPVDHLVLPVPTVKLVNTLRRYIEREPDGTYPPGSND